MWITGGKLELFEAKWTELPDLGNTVNLNFDRNIVGRDIVSGGSVIARTPHAFPFSNEFHAMPVADLA